MSDPIPTLEDIDTLINDAVRAEYWERGYWISPKLFDDDQIAIPQAGQSLLPDELAPGKSHRAAARLNGPGKVDAIGLGSVFDGRSAVDQLQAYAIHGQPFPQKLVETAPVLWDRLVEDDDATSVGSRIRCSFRAHPCGQV